MDPLFTDPQNLPHCILDDDASLLRFNGIAKVLTPQRAMNHQNTNAVSFYAMHHPAEATIEREQESFTTYPDRFFNKILDGPQLTGVRAPPSTPETHANSGPAGFEDVEEQELGKSIANKHMFKLGLGESIYAPKKHSPLAESSQCLKDSQERQKALEDLNHQSVSVLNGESSRVQKPSPSSPFVKAVPVPPSVQHDVTTTSDRWSVSKEITQLNQIVGDLNSRLAYLRMEMERMSVPQAVQPNASRQVRAKSSLHQTGQMNQTPASQPIREFDEPRKILLVLASKENLSPTFSTSFLDNLYTSNHLQNTTTSSLLDGSQSLEPSLSSVTSCNMPDMIPTTSRGIHYKDGMEILIGLLEMIGKTATSLQDCVDCMKAALSLSATTSKQTPKLDNKSAPIKPDAAKLPPELRALYEQLEAALKEAESENDGMKVPKKLLDSMNDKLGSLQQDVDSLKGLLAQKLVVLSEPTGSMSSDHAVKRQDEKPAPISTAAPIRKVTMSHLPPNCTTKFVASLVDDWAIEKIEKEGDTAEVLFVKSKDAVAFTDQYPNGLSFGKGKNDYVLIDLSNQTE